jgi:hypothetical protein
MYRPLCVFYMYVLQQIAVFVVINVCYFEEGVSRLLRSTVIYSTKLYGV